MGIDRDFDNLMDDDPSDYGCDDVDAHIQECTQAGKHLISVDEDGSCTNCGHS